MEHFFENLPLEQWLPLKDGNELKLASLLVQEGDGLHFAPEGQRFVGAQLVELLTNIGAGPDELPMELPRSAGVDGKNYVHSFLMHQQAARRVAIGNGRAAPTPPEDSHASRGESMAAVAGGAFVAGLCAAGLVFVAWRSRGRALVRSD